MADQWMRDFREAASLAEELKKTIRQSGSRDGMARARENNELESYLRELDESIAHLDGGLERGGFSDGDYQKRRGMLGDLSKKTRDLKSQWKSKGQSGAKGALMGSSSGGGNRSSPGRGPPREDSTTIGMSDGDMVQAQEQVLKQQDQNLDQIHGMVRKVNEIARNIGDEGRLQDKLLDQVYDEQETVNRKMQKEHALMEKVYRSAGNGKGMCLICLMVVAIVVLLVVMLQ